MDELGLCKYCGKPVNEDCNFTLDHTTGIYGEDKEPTIVREGVFCSRSCLIRWLQEADECKAYGAVKKEALEKLGSICVDVWEHTPAYNLFTSILLEFRAIGKITPWDVHDSPFATNTGCIWCLPFAEYKRLRTLQRELKTFLDSAKQGFDRIFYGPPTVRGTYIKLVQEEEASG